MIITIDTKKDSPEDIQRAIDILKQYAKPITDSDSKILESIPKETSTHRPTGSGVFDQQKAKEEVPEAPAEIQEPKTEISFNKEDEEEQSTFKTQLFSNNNIKNDFEEEKPSIEHHGGRITRGTAPDFTSYLDLLKQKRDRQVMGMMSDQKEEMQ